MNIRPPLQEQVGNGWTPGWSAFFTQLFESIGWVKGWSFKFELDFPAVPNHSQSAGIDIQIQGVREGDSVTVTPYQDVAGIDYKAFVSADNVVTIYAYNFSNPAIDPPAMFYRVVVIQNYNAA